MSALRIGLPTRSESRNAHAVLRKLRKNRIRCPAKVLLLVRLSIRWSSGGMTLDREKKIAEIREALEKEQEIKKIRDVVEHRRSHSYYEMVYNENHEKYIRFLLSELDKRDECTKENPCRECLKMSVDGYKEIVRELEDENRKLLEERDAYYNNARYTEVAFHEVTSLRSQLQSAQQEIERLGNLARQERELADHWMRKHHDDVVKLREEREKMIEALRKLAKTNAENISEIREWKAKQNDPEVIDLDWYNYVARDILKEIGVTVE